MARIDAPRSAVTPLRLALVLVFLLACCGGLFYLFGMPLRMMYWGRECRGCGGSAGLPCATAWSAAAARSPCRLQSAAPPSTSYACAVYARVRPMVDEGDLLRQGKQVPGAPPPREHCFKGRAAPPGRARRRLSCSCRRPARTLYA